MLNDGGKVKTKISRIPPPLLLNHHDAFFFGIRYNAFPNITLIIGQYILLIGYLQPEICVAVILSCIKAV